MSKCQKVFRAPIHSSVTIGSPSVGKCENDALPGMLFCSEHATRDAMDMAIKILVRELKKRDPEFVAKEWS